MAVEDFLAALGAGMGQAGEILSYDRAERAKAERQRMLDEAQRRRDALDEMLAELQIQQGTARLHGDAADRAEKARLAEEKRIADEMTGVRRDVFKTSLPSDLRQAAEADELGYPFKPSDFRPPEPEKEADFTLGPGQQRFRAGGGTPIASVPNRPFAPRASSQAATDDPSLPNGVRSYIATMVGRYEEQGAANQLPPGVTARDVAMQELRKVLPDLYKAHPRLDAKKAMDMVEELLPKPTGTDPFLGPPGSQPGGRSQGPGPSALPSPRPPQAAAPPPAAAPAPTAAPALDQNLRTQIQGLIQAFDAEQDPARKAQIQQEMRALRQRLSGVR